MDPNAKKYEKCFKLILNYLLFADPSDKSRSRILKIKEKIGKNHSYNLVKNYKKHFLCQKYKFSSRRVLSVCVFLNFM